MAEDGDAPLDTDDNDTNNITITQDLLSQLFQYAQQQMQNTGDNKFSSNNLSFNSQFYPSNKLHTVTMIKMKTKRISTM